MKTVFRICTVAILFMAACVKDTRPGIDDVNEADRTFAATAGQLYLAHYELSKVAFNNSTDSTVILLAEKVVLTSNSAYYELIQIGNQKGLAVTGSLDETHLAYKNDLSNLSGSALDSTYLHLLVEDQHVLLSAFDVLSQTGNNLTLRDHGARFADTMLQYHEVADSLADLY